MTKKQWDSPPKMQIDPSKVVKGQEIVDAMRQGDKMERVKVSEV